jgi:hypothetical protein
MRTPSPPSAGFVLRVFLLLVIAYNVRSACLHTMYSWLGTDELQHVHVAWEMSRGKVQYLDFFDHHGPVFSTLNAGLIRVFGLQPGFDTVMLLRSTSIAYLALMLALTYLIGRLFVGSVSGGLFSAAILSSLAFFQDNASEFRPDVLQNAFWLAGVFLLLDHLGKGGRWRAFSAGGCFAFVVFSTSKGAIGPSAVGLYFAAALAFGAYDWKRLAGDASLVLMGFFSVAVPFCAYLWLLGSLEPFLYFNFYFNLALLAGYHTNQTPNNLGAIWGKNGAFVALTLFGLSALARTLARGAGGPAGFPRTLFMFTVSSAMALSSLNPLYPHYFLCILPLLSVVCAHGLSVLWALIGRLPPTDATLLAAVGVAAVFVSLLYQHPAPTAPTGHLLDQREQTEYIIENAGRDEPVLFYWNNCGGYMFNEDVQYYWMGNEGMDRLIPEVAGSDVFGPQLIRLIEGERVRFLVQGAFPSQEVNDYVRAHYFPARGSCLWIRNSSWEGGG